MKLLLQGHDERYTVEQSLLNLFPGELPVYEPILPGDDSWAVVTLREEDDCCHVTTELRWQGRQTSHREVLPLSGTEYAREGQRRHAVGACFFLAAQAVSGVRPPWGMLTGVRPDKPATAALAAGRTPEETRAWMERFYYVSPDRAALAVETASAALRASCRLERRDIAVYVGIPFCPTRCAYCSFVSADVGRALKLVDPYVEALLEEVRRTGQVLEQAGLRVRTLYVGGGTPTTLSASQLDRLLAAAEAHLPLAGCREMTVEAGRPDTITREKLEVLREHGIERISINPQTMSDQVLQAIGRRHTARDIREAFCTAREVDFACINMDLIAGLPQDSVEGFRDSLEEVLALRPENITVHTLAMKKGSRLMEEGGALPSGEETARMVDLSLEALEGAGYRPYYLYRQKYMSGGLENVSWCLPGTENHYNIIMMEELQSVLSLGAGGVTKLVDRSSGRIVRLTNPKYPHDYLAMSAKVLEQKDEILRFYREV